MSYEYERERANPIREPSLSEMTRVAIEVTILPTLYEKLFGIEQGSQTQIDRRVAFQRKDAPRAQFNGDKALALLFVPRIETNKGEF
jgi:hypothetical protein